MPIRRNDLSFKMSIDAGPGGTMQVSFKGTVDGDELTLTSTMEGAPGGGPAEQTFVATRAE